MLNISYSVGLLDLLPLLSVCLRPASIVYRFDIPNIHLFGRSFTCFKSFVGSLECLDVIGFQLLFISWYASTWKVVDMLLLTFSGVVLIFEPFWSISVINCTELSSVKASFNCNSISLHFSHADSLFILSLCAKYSGVVSVIWYDNVNVNNYVIHHTDLISDVQTGILKVCMNLFSLMHSLSTCFCLIYFTNSQTSIFIIKNK